MASLLPLLLICVATITRAASQPVNGTEESVSTEAVPVNVTTSPELPPGGLPEVLVDEVSKDVPETPTPVGDNPPVQERKLKEEEPKTIAVNPDAITVKVIGSKCENATDCLDINNTSCISNVCDCIPGFIPSKHSLDKCLKVPTGLDDTCEEEAQCAHVVPVSECRGGVCSCPPNYVFDLGRCWENKLLGGFCNTSVQCENVVFSLCAQGVCACQPPLIPSPNSNKCLQTAGTLYRATCEEDIQCSDSYGDEAHCSNSQCICTNNYHFNGTTCVADKKLGEQCESDADCAVSDVNNIENSRACVSGICSCAEGFTFLHGEDMCMEIEKSSGEELAVSFTWLSCIFIAKFYLS